MTDKTEEQLARERAAVASMSSAKANMENALNRIQSLEAALRSASRSITTLKGFIAPQVYTYSVNGNSRTCTAVADDAIAEIAKVLG